MYDKLEGNVRVTDKYDSFQRMPGNRPISRSHVNKIKNSMLEKDLEIPIIVNEKMQIADGQHTLEARKLNNYPVYYIIKPGLTADDVQRFNTNKHNWKLDDYTSLYAEQKYWHYIEHRKFRERYGFGHREATVILSGENSPKDKEFKEGKFIIPSLKTAEDKAKKIQQVKPYYTGWNRRSFVMALLHCFENPNYDHKKFIQKLSYQSTKLVDCTNTELYIRLIEEIYNFKTPKEEKIRLI